MMEKDPFTATAHWVSKSGRNTSRNPDFLAQKISSSILLKKYSKSQSGYAFWSRIWMEMGIWTWWSLILLPNFLNYKKHPCRAKGSCWSRWFLLFRCSFWEWFSALQWISWQTCCVWSHRNSRIDEKSANPHAGGYSIIGIWYDMLLV
jgi:hypothetical protein